jgi:hypothetical protein
MIDNKVTVNYLTTGLRDAGRGTSGLRELCHFLVDNTDMVVAKEASNETTEIQNEAD